LKFLSAQAARPEELQIGGAKHFSNELEPNSGDAASAMRASNAKIRARDACVRRTIVQAIIAPPKLCHQ
jgi:hypothetical protein